MEMIKLDYTPTKEQHELAKLAQPLVKYLNDNLIIGGTVIVTETTVIFQHINFMAEYSDDFTKITTVDDKCIDL